MNHVYELSFDTEDAARLRRAVTDSLAHDYPGWERCVEIFWPE